jgi:hypothetical protein
MAVVEGKIANNSSSWGFEPHNGIQKTIRVGCHNDDFTVIQGLFIIDRIMKIYWTKRVVIITYLDVEFLVLRTELFLVISIDKEVSERLIKAMDI